MSSTENHIKNIQAFNNVRNSEEKLNVIREAFKVIDKELHTTYGSLNIDLCEENLIEVRPSVYAGTIKANVGITTAEGLKRIVVSTAVSNSKPYIKNAKGLLSTVAAQLEILQGPIDLQMIEASDKSYKELKSMQAEIEMENKVTALMEAGKTYKEATEDVYDAFKIAKEITVTDTNNNPSAVIGQPKIDKITYNKAYLPESAEVGDVVNVEGRKFTITGVDTVNPDMWILEIK